MAITLKKTGGIAFTAGFVIAFLLAILGRGLDAINLHPGAWLSTVYTILWPTGILLIDADANLAGYAFLAVSLISNGIIYAFGAVLITYYVKLAKNRGYDFRDDD